MTAALQLAHPVDFSREQLELIKTQIAPGASDGELGLFIEQCKRTGLDPLSRQIYAVMRETRQQVNGQWVSVKKMTIQTSIDGFRVIAERHGQYAGQMGPWWCGPDGKWVDVWLGNEPPAAARVGVLRRDFVEPLFGIARYDSFAQKNRDGKPISQWGTMPDVMVAKCAEAQALRRAFPNDLSGLYTGDEMAQADSGAQQPQEAPPQVQQESKPTEDAESARRRLYGPRLGRRRDALKTYGVTEDQVSQELAKLAPWYFSDENAENAVAALTTWGVRLKAEHEARAVSESDSSQQGTVEGEFTPAPAALIHAGQRTSLMGFIKRAGVPDDSAARSAFYAYMLPGDIQPGTRTNALTFEQARGLLAVLGTMDADTFAQTGTEFRTGYMRGQA